MITTVRQTKRQTDYVVIDILAQNDRKHDIEIILNGRLSEFKGGESRVVKRRFQKGA